LKPWAVLYSRFAATSRGPCQGRTSTRSGHAQGERLLTVLRALLVSAKSWRRPFPKDTEKRAVLPGWPRKRARPQSAGVPCVVCAKDLPDRRDRSKRPPDHTPPGEEVCLRRQPDNRRQDLPVAADRTPHKWIHRRRPLRQSKELAIDHLRPGQGN